MRVDRNRWAMSRVGPLALLVASSSLLWAARGAFAPALAEPNGAELHAPIAACGYCELEEPSRRRDASASMVDSIGRAADQHNRAVFARTDSLYRVGRFGKPGSESGRRNARLHAQIRSWNGFTYTSVLAAHPTRLFTVSGEEPLYPFARSYANSAVFPLCFVDRAVIGPAGFCVTYHMPEVYDEWVKDGGVRVRVRRETVDAEKRRGIPMISRQMPTSLHSTVELLYENGFCGSVFTRTIVDRGDTLDILALRDLEGTWVRKLGFHRMGALLEWRSHVEGDRDPDNVRCGAVAYFPEISLSMPLFLPDLGLDDVREFDFPLPMLSSEFYERPADTPLDWLRVEPNGTIQEWRGAGPRPAIVSEICPDL